MLLGRFQIRYFRGNGTLTRVDFDQYSMLIGVIFKRDI